MILRKFYLRFAYNFFFRQKIRRIPYQPLRNLSKKSNTNQTPVCEKSESSTVASHHRFQGLTRCVIRNFHKIKIEIQSVDELRYRQNMQNATENFRLI